jgi:hypothetical protein
MTDWAGFAESPAEWARSLGPAQPGSPAYERGHPRTGREVYAQAANEIQIEAPEWLIEGELPMGGISLIAGREGCGKSNYWADLAARVTTGRLSALDGRTPGVAVMATEDSWASVIAPRLACAGARLDRIYRIGVRDLDVGTDLTLSLPDDLEGLEALIIEKDIGLVVLDPLISRLRESLDTHKDAEVRQALEPLTALAEKTHTTVIGLIHVSKMQTDDPLTSIMGSRAFGAVARSVLYVIQAPGSWGEHDRGKRFIGVGKSNYAEANTRVRVFMIQGEMAGTDARGKVVQASKVFWLGRIPGVGVRDILSNINARGDKEEIMASFREDLGQMDHPVAHRSTGTRRDGTPVAPPLIPPTGLLPTAAPEPEGGAEGSFDPGLPLGESGTAGQITATEDGLAAMVEKAFPGATEITDLSYIKANWRKLPTAELRQEFAAADLSDCLTGATSLSVVVSAQKILAAPAEKVALVRLAMEDYLK